MLTKLTWLNDLLARFTSAVCCTLLAHIAHKPYRLHRIVSLAPGAAAVIDNPDGQPGQSEIPALVSSDL